MIARLIVLKNFILLFITALAALAVVDCIISLN